MEGAVTILLVEDEPLLRGAFRALLEASGYRVTEAGTAAEALDRAAAEPPALVLLDLGLPDDSGLAVARALRTRPATRAVPVVAMTGRSGSDIRRQCADAGCTDQLVKPIAPRELARRIPGWLGRATGDPAGTPA